MIQPLKNMQTVVSEQNFVDPDDDEAHNFVNKWIQLNEKAILQKS